MFTTYSQNIQKRNNTFTHSLTHSLTCTQVHTHRMANKRGKVADEPDEGPMGILELFLKLLCRSAIISK